MRRIHGHIERSRYLPHAVAFAAPIEVFLLVEVGLFDQNGGRNHLPIGGDARKIVVEARVDGFQVHRVEWHWILAQSECIAKPLQHLDFDACVAAVGDGFRLVDSGLVATVEIENFGHHALRFAVARHFWIVDFCQNL